MVISFDDLLDAMPKERQERIIERSRQILSEQDILQAALDAESTAENAAFSGGELIFAIYQNNDGKFRFRLEGPAGVTLLESPDFANRADARTSLEAFRRRVTDAELRDHLEAA